MISEIRKMQKIEAKRLGFSSTDEALRHYWADAPNWLRKDLLNLGFDPQKGA